MRTLALVSILPLLFFALSCKEQRFLARSGTYAADDPSARYVGKEACKACHAANHMTFTASEMGRSFKDATLDNSDAVWDDVEPLYDATNNLYYQPFHRGQELFVREYRIENGDTVHQRIEKVAYIVGSGQHTNSHMRSVNGYVYQIPVTYYTQQKRWDLAPGFEGSHTRFDRLIEVECMTCHNARPEFVLGSENRYTHVPQGIDCEQCHGPGSIHISEMEALRTVDITKETDFTIVNPRKLSPARQLDVCSRCHMQGAAVLQPNLTFLDFRPSRALESFVNVYWPRFSDSTSYFIMASHPARLKMSPCFKETWKQGSKYSPMTCVTCHNPHISVRHQGTDNFNKTCKSCHTPANLNECTEEPDVRARANDNCFGCHMPITASSDIPHVQITDHYIRSRPGKVLSTWADVERHNHESQPFQRMATLVDNTPDARGRADGFITYFEQYRHYPYLLDSAQVYIAEARKSHSDLELATTLIRYWYVRQDFDRIIRFARANDLSGVRHAWTLYRIGESFLSRNAPQEAILYMEDALALGPDHLRFRSKVAEAYAAAGDLQRALTEYDRVLSLNPTLEDELNNRGFIYVRLQQFDPAEKDFKAALALNPDAELPLANLASLYLNTNRRDEARKLAARLLKVAPANPSYMQLWDALK